MRDFESFGYRLGFSCRWLLWRTNSVLWKVVSLLTSDPRFRKWARSGSRCSFTGQPEVDPRLFCCQKVSILCSCCDIQHYSTKLSIEHNELHLPSLAVSKFLLIGSRRILELEVSTCLFPEERSGLKIPFSLVNRFCTPPLKPRMSKLNCFLSRN